MFSKIDVSKIIINHYKTLSNLNKKGISIMDLILFMFIPLLISYLLVDNDISIKKQVGNLITALSILAGFLFNLLAIIYSFIDKIRQRIKEQGEQKTSLKFRLTNEIHSNISYNILVALTLIIFLIVFTFDITFKNSFCTHIFDTLLNYICLSLLIHFILTLFMILKRIYILIDSEN